MDEYVLWGSHPSYIDGTPIKVTGGTMAQVKAAMRQRERDGGWTLAIYASGVEPTGLRLQVVGALNEPERWYQLEAELERMQAESR